MHHRGISFYSIRNLSFTGPLTFRVVPTTLATITQNASYWFHHSFILSLESWNPFIRAPSAASGIGRCSLQPQCSRRSYTRALFNSIQARVHHWASSAGRNPVSAPVNTAEELTPVARERPNCGGRNRDLETDRRRPHLFNRKTQL